MQVQRAEGRVHFGKMASVADVWKSVQGKTATGGYKRPVVNVRRGMPINGGRVGPLTGRVAEAVAQKPTREWEYRFTPIKEIDAYLRSLRNTGVSEEELAELRVKHERMIPPPQEPKYRYIPETGPHNPVKTTLKIKGGKVRVSTKVPYDGVYSYTRRGKPVPFEVMVRAMKLNGASDEFLVKAIEEHDRAMARRDKEGEAFMKIFDKYTSTKAKPKELKAVKKLPPTFD